MVTFINHNGMVIGDSNSPFLLVLFISYLLRI